LGLPDVEDEDDEYEGNLYKNSNINNKKYKKK
jgi:hypothetical protein